MAQHLLLATFCVLFAVNLISSVEGVSSCRSRCALHCRFHKKKHELQVPLVRCLKNCQELPKHCRKCNQAENKCWKCLPGFRMISKRDSRCTPCDTGCLYCDARKCLSCLTGYVMTANGCSACPAGCICNSTGVCVDCQTGYVGSVPSTGPPSCLACPANCAICSTTGPTGCVTCNGGFTLIDDVCQPCHQSGCLVCTSGLETCDTCKVGYLRTATASPKVFTCAACPAHCFSCSIAGTTYCDRCIEGYGLTRNRKGCIACAPHCKTCNWNGYNSCDSHQCGFSFFQRYNIIGGKCVEPSCPQFCERCTSEDTCDQCMTGFTWSSSLSACIGTGCTAAIGGCIQCEPTYGTKCQQCLSNMVLYLGYCFACGVDGKCLRCVVDVANEELICLRCIDGYIASTDSRKGLCWPCVVGCKDCTPANMDTATGFCKTCSGGILPDKNGQCGKICDPKCAPPFCAVQGSKKCDLNCVEGYVLDTSTYTCLPCDNDSGGCKHCLSVGNTKCDGPQCADGYTLTAENKCSKV